MEAEIQVLGTFAVRIDGHPVDPAGWRRRHAALLVKLLALAPRRRLHRELVIDQLWPDADLRAAGPRLQKAAHFARRALGTPAGIVVDGDTIALLPDAVVRTDADSFRARAIDALADGSTAAAAEALAAYGGELLPDDRYEPWTDQLRAALAALHLDLLRQAERWEEVLDLDPADEAAHLALALGHRQRGERTAALRQLDRLASALEDELGVEPGPAAVALRAELLADERRPSVAPATSTPRRTPRTRYADSDGHAIAYQVIGEGPRDLVFIPGFVSNVDLQWEHPAMAAFFERLSDIARLIVFDKRATGLSERLPLDWIPTLEDRMDDVRAVMDAAGSTRASVFGISEGGPMALLFAAAHPERVDRLALYGSFGSRPFGERAAGLAADTKAWWGSGSVLGYLAPSWASDHATRRFFARYERQSATPGVAGGIIRLASEVDVESLLGGVSTPTLVLHRAGDPVITIDRARALARGLPDATLVELPGTDHLAYVDGGQILDHVEAFLTGTVARPAEQRILTTILFTDVVDSTGQVSELGDARWRDLLATFLAGARDAVTDHRGDVRNVAGDGLMATFDGPARAVRAAADVQALAAKLGIRLRSGVHTAEVELIGGDIAGIGVHVASRVSTAATPGTTWVTRTVRDLVAGSGLVLASRGVHELKGMAEPWELYEVTAT